jgi:hypothetical protein
MEKINKTLTKLLHIVEDGWTDGWMDEWMDGLINRRFESTYMMLLCVMTD